MNNSWAKQKYHRYFEAPPNKKRFSSYDVNEKYGFERQRENKSKQHQETFNRKAGGKVEVHSDECETYFKNALESLKRGIPDDQKDIFIHNVLEQTTGQELQLSCQSVGSRLVEVLLEQSSDISTILRFMRALAECREESCGNRFASYVTENLLYYGLLQLQNWSQEIDSESQDEEAKAKATQLIEIMTWIHELGEFCLTNLQTCLEDEHGCHVLRTLIQVLGGHYMGESGINQSKRGQKLKRQFEEEYLDTSTVCRRKQALHLKEVPKFFVTVLKKMSHSFLAIDNLKIFLVEGYSSPVFQSHLLVLKNRLPKHSKKFNKAVINIVFESQSSDGVPEALTHKSCSYLVEKIFECCNEDQQGNIWKEYFCGYLDKIVVHPVGNFVLQRLLDIVENKDLFETMSTSILELFPVIYSTHHFGLFVSVSSACKRLGRQQAQFMKSLMQCLQCSEEDRQEALLPLLLGFQTFDSYSKNRESSDRELLHITLQGSLVAQSILKFDKPMKCIRSLLNMKPELLKYLACHIQGCHVLTAFLESVSVGGKSKDKFLGQIKPVLVPLASDRNGSHTLVRMWVLLSLKQRVALAQEIAKNEKKLSENPNGLLLIKKTRIYQFKNKREDWEHFQSDLTKKRTASN